MPREKRLASICALGLGAGLVLAACLPAAWQSLTEVRTAAQTATAHAGWLGKLAALVPSGDLFRALALNLGTLALGVAGGIRRPFPGRRGLLLATLAVVGLMLEVGMTHLFSLLYLWPCLALWAGVLIRKKEDADPPAKPSFSLLSQGLLWTVLLFHAGLAYGVRSWHGLARREEKAAIRQALNKVPALLTGKALVASNDWRSYFIFRSAGLGAGVNPWPNPGEREKFRAYIARQDAVLINEHKPLTEWAPQFYEWNLPELFEPPISLGHGYQLYLARKKSKNQ